MASSSSPPEPNRIGYLPLYNAIRNGDLESVEELCKSDSRALKAGITVNFDTALHVAVGTGEANHIVKYLLSNMSKDQVALKNNEGNTVLSIAAIVGNVEAAEMIMNERPDLNDVPNNCGRIPLIEAARHGCEEMIKHLLQFSESYLRCSRYSADKTGVLFVKEIIIAGFYDLALDLVKKYPNLAITEFDGGESLLSAIARIPFAFPSARKLGFWKRVDIFAVLAKCAGKIYDRRALDLVKFLCKEIAENLDYESAFSILKRPLFLAAKLGVPEVVEEIITSFHDAVWFIDAENHNAFQLALMNRQENVFNLIFKMSIGERRVLLMSKDNNGNNILHLAGKRAPQKQLELTCGEALQMQRELWWFQGVKAIVQPAYKEDINNDGKTPAMVFTEEHEQLVKEGKEWMKSAATSCSIVAALVATVVFVGTITVPGGNNSDGQPIFLKQIAFQIYKYLDTFSLISSVFSILMFLSVLTSRYAEVDFLVDLPTRFICGLFLLLCSVASMMITSLSAVHLVFSDRKGGIFRSVGLCTFLFLLLLTHTQVPLLLEVIYSTFGPKVFADNRRVIYFHSCQPKLCRIVTSL